MKKIAMLFLILTFLTSCTAPTNNNTQITNAKKDEQINFYINYIDLLKYYEHTLDTIYSLNYISEQGVSIYKTNISEEKTKYYMSIDEAKTLEDINDMKVSNNNQYMAITLNEENERVATKLQIIKLKDLTSQELHDVSNYKLFEYVLIDFYKENEIEFDLTNNNIQIIGFSGDGEVLWGGIATKLDMPYSFIIHMNTGKVDFLKDQESYNKAREEYKVVN